MADVLPSSAFPERSPCLSYQVLTATNHKDLNSSCPLNNSLTHQPTTFHSTQLNSLYSNLRFISLGTDHIENTVLIFLRARMLQPLPSNHGTMNNCWQSPTTINPIRPHQPRDSNPEDGNYSVCRNVAVPSAVYVECPRKPKSCIEPEQWEP
jgi:hypothetical protein